MKKMKKLFAVLLTLAMILGMSMTTFAAETSQIKVTGLSSQEDETVNLYPAITWDEANSKWNVATWASDYIQLVDDKYEITNAEGLTAAVTGTPHTQTHSAGSTEVTFDGIPVGAYVITASGNKISYAPMVAETYNKDATYMEAKNVEVVAKTDGYNVTKKAKDHFVARGQEVEFSITTTFPSFEVADSDENSFTIVDTPTGLDITQVVSVKIGGATVTNYGKNRDDNGVYTIDLSSSIGTSNANAGKTVIVTYKATVTSDEGYENTANAFRNGVKMGQGNEEGFSGDITLTKYNKDKSKALEGAEFKLYKGTKDSHGDALYVVPTENGTYKVALSASEQGATQTLVTVSNGTLKVTGLDEGKYWFEETKAPKGYSINSDGASAEITVVDEHAEAQSEETEIRDSKLSSLPSTGGIGTTIFTIAGCIIMIAAAGLFFASRKKSDNK